VETDGIARYSTLQSTDCIRIASYDSSRKLIQLGLTATFCATMLFVVAQTANANPIGGNVMNGSASFATTGNTLTVTNTPGTIINWQGFSINSNEVTRFAQQSAASTVLNRVVGSDASNIMGTLQSNGRVFLINPNGILFGAGAVVDVAGLMASTLKLSDADFLAGNHHYTQVPGAGNISNAGNISSQQGGQIYLIAPNVENTGVITAPNGEILLAAGYSVDLVSTDNPDLRVNITAPAGDATNVGQLIASSGSLGLFGTVVSNNGMVSADSATMEGGKIVFRASRRAEAGGTISANGTSGGSVDISAAHSLDPNAPGVVIQTGSIAADGTAGAGGSVSISADSILSTAAIDADGTAAGGQISMQASNRVLSTASAQFSASSTEGQGGDILVSADVSNYTSGSYSATGVTGGAITMAGNEIKLAAAQLDASGMNGGGTIHVGGLMQGAAGFVVQGTALTNSTNVLVNSATTLNADALQTGNGGEVVLWSDQAMGFTGSISAKGGAISGNGGNAEVSGVTSFGYGGLTDLSAVNGSSGSLLLDPTNITIVSGGAGLPYQEIFDPTPGAGEGFGGATNIGLANGNIVIASPLDSLNGASSGAVYLYTPAGSLVSALVGSAAGDQVGSSITQLTNDNIVVVSSNWGSGGIVANALGAVTWMDGKSGTLSDGTTGGTVSAANSLIGAASGDTVGYGGITEITDNATFWNVAVRSDQWGSAGVSGEGLGAVTWMDGATGLLSDGSSGGAVKSGNSLVGSTLGDGSWIMVTPLSNGNMAVSMPLWDNNIFVDAGAVTWMNGATGKLADGSTGGAISVSISLVGSGTGDRIGYYTGANGVTPLSNGNYLVRSQAWGSNSTSSFGGPGAVTWIDGGNGNTVNSGPYGATVSSANSLVGSSSTDYLGSYSITELPVNGNIVIPDGYWNVSAGSATWMNGKTGALMGGAFGGAISATNSLVGTVANEQAGSTVFALTNGNYLLADHNYNNGTGAVVFGNGTTGIAGNVSAVNSLIGSLFTDQVGWTGFQAGIVILANGNYLVQSPSWNGGAGAVTFGNGNAGTLGTVSQSNSLIGSVSTDQVGATVTLLTGSNYVVTSANWNNPLGVTQVGAVTWGNGSTGTVGFVSSTNSLVGSTASDRVGYYGITLLSNGNYVVNSPYWNNSAGAVTFSSGTVGVTGAVSASNSLVGSTGDSVGIGGITALTNGNYVVSSYSWNGGSGAATWGNGSTGTVGTVSAANSLVGNAGDNVGSYGVTALANGNYVVNSDGWSNGSGAVTWGNGSTGTVGTVSSSNSLVGGTAGDSVGSDGVTALTSGNYIVSSTFWNGGYGAVTWGDGATGKLADGSSGGIVSASNSLLGSTINDHVGSSGGIGRNIVELAGNGNLVITNYSWGSAGGSSDGLGAVTWMNGANGKLADGTTGGVISAANSLLGSTLGDLVGSSCDCTGSGFTIALSDGNYAVLSPSWTNGSLSGAGAATLGLGATGSVGKVSSANSLVGTAASEYLGSGAVVLIGQPDKVLIGSAAANNGKGGVYLLGGTVAQVGGSISFNDPGVDVSMGAALITGTLNTGTNVVLQAINDITQSAGADVIATGSGSLTLQAGHNMILDGVINIKGSLDISANDPGAIQASGGGVLDASLANLTASKVRLINYGGDVTIGTIQSGLGGVDVVAVNGNFISASGSATPITSTGNISVYSTDPRSDTLNGMSSNYHRYNCTYSATLGTVCGTPGTDLTATGIGFFYTLAPTLAITANAATKTYGAADILTYSASGFIGTDTSSTPGMFSGALGRAAGETVLGGPYAINQGTLFSPMGYSISSFTPSNLNITVATLTVAANDASKILNTADPPLTYSVSGLQFTDTAASTGLTASLTRAPGETVGTYPISFLSAGLTSTNYILNLVGADFTILVPTVINQIVDTSNQDRKPTEEILASAVPTGESGNTQSLPMCN